MFGDGSLTFQEFITREPLPLATVHDALLEFLRGRNDAVLLGAHAVNAYVKDARMTQDVDLASTRAKELTEDTCQFLRERFEVELRIVECREGHEFRVYQVRRPERRHLVDVRSVTTLPSAKRIKRVLVIAPAELIAAKVQTMVGRRRTPKAMSDQADLYRLLLTFSELKVKEGAVSDCLRAAQAGQPILDAWNELVARDIQPEGDDDEFLR